MFYLNTYLEHGKRYLRLVLKKLEVSELHCNNPDISDIVSNTQFCVVGQGNRFLELRSVGFPWQENQKGEKEQ